MNLGIKRSSFTSTSTRDNPASFIRPWGTREAAERNGWIRIIFVRRRLRRARPSSQPNGENPLCEIVQQLGEFAFSRVLLPFRAGFRS